MKIANDNEGISPVLIREVSILRELSHPNIVKYSSMMNNKLFYRLQLCYMDFSEVKLYFEYMDYDLKHYIDEFSGKIDSNTIKCIMYQLLCGLNYLHQNRIIHRDIKPQVLIYLHSTILEYFNR